MNLNKSKSIYDVFQRKTPKRSNVNLKEKQEKWRRVDIGLRPNANLISLI